jgi:hypothetical protein
VSDERAWQARTLASFVAHGYEVDDEEPDV